MATISYISIALHAWLSCRHVVVPSSRVIVPHAYVTAPRPRESQFASHSSQTVTGIFQRSSLPNKCHELERYLQEVSGV